MLSTTGNSQPSYITIAALLLPSRNELTNIIAETTKNGPSFHDSNRKPSASTRTANMPAKRRRVGAKLAATPRFRTRHCTNTERNIVPASDEAGKLTGGESLANSDT